MNDDFFNRYLEEYLKTPDLSDISHRYETAFRADRFQKPVSSRSKENLFILN